jgi:hypothetical protein
MLIPPVPENKSRTSIPSKSTLLFSKLNKPSFAKSVVGRAVILDGALILLPLNVPLIILMFL